MKLELGEELSAKRLDPRGSVQSDLDVSRDVTEVLRLSLLVNAHTPRAKVNCTVGGGPLAEVPKEADPEWLHHQHATKKSLHFQGS